MTQNDDRQNNNLKAPDGMSAEDAIKKALNTPLPDSVVNKREDRQSEQADEQE